MRSVLIRGAALVLAFALSTGATLAQTYPTKPLRIIVPWPSGGLDLLPRVMSEPLAERLGQPVIIENRPGAGGTLGIAQVAKAPPDGYLLVMTDISSHAISGALYRDLPYDIVRDFTPVSLAAVTPMVLAVNPAIPVRTVAELLTYARAQGKPLSYASSGNGAITHLAGERLKRAAGIDLVHVPYKGSPPAIAALLAGDVTLAFSTVPPVLAHARSGKIRLLGTTLDEPLAAQPEVQPIERELPRFRMGLYMGLMAPAGTPRDIAARLHDAMKLALDAPKVREFMNRASFTPLAHGPDAFAVHLAAEARSWGELVREVGLKID